MKNRIRMKLSLLWKVLKNRNCILVYLDKDEFEYKFSGDNLMFSQLYLRLTQYVPQWYKGWLKKNPVSAEIVTGMPVPDQQHIDTNVSQNEALVNDNQKQSKDDAISKPGDSKTLIR